MRKRPDPSAAVTDAPETFASRWSRRKQAVRDAVPATDASQPGPAVGAEADSASGACVPPPAPLAEADLPPLEALNEHSDYSGFLSPGVSEALRRRALRQLFGSSKFQFRDGLDDYDDDYRNFDSLGAVITADMRHRLDAEAARVARATVPDAGVEAKPETVAQSSQACATEAPAADAPVDCENSPNS